MITYGRYGLCGYIWVSILTLSSPRVEKAEEAEEEEEEEEEEKRERVILAMTHYWTWHHKRAPK